MAKCNTCHITVRDNTQVCPLCRCVLQKDEISEIGYPNIIKKRHKLQVASRIYLFSALMVEAILIYLNLTYYPSFKWSVIPGCIMAYGYLTLSYLVYGTRSSYGFDILLAVVTLVASLDVCDKLLGGYGWSFNYVTPGLLMAANLLVLAQIIINKNGWQTYIIAQLGLFVISLVSIPLVFTGHVTQPLVSVIAIGLSIVLFVGTLIIGGARAKEELYRRFHF